MRMKSRLLLPAGGLAATLFLTACPPPQPDPGPGPGTTQAPPNNPPAGTTSCGPASSAAVGPDGSDPIASWGVDGSAEATVVIGNVVYVGGTFNNAVSPSGRHRSPRQPGRVLPGGRQPAVQLLGQLRRRGQSTPSPRTARACSSGGNFTTMNGAASNRLVKLNAETGARDTSFALIRFRPPGPPRRPTRRKACSTWTTPGPPACSRRGRLRQDRHRRRHHPVDQGRQRRRVQLWPRRAGRLFRGGTDKQVESIAVSPDGSTVFLGGNFVDVKRPSQTVAGTPRDRLARVQSSGAGALDS